MKIEYVEKKPTNTTVGQVPADTLFYADEVGYGGPGLYYKLEDGALPVFQGKGGAWGSKFSSETCPITGYNPVKSLKVGF